MTFWLDPDSGDRLGYGMSVLFTMVTLELSRGTSIPISHELTWLSYIYFACFLFAFVNVLETGIVYLLYFLRTKTLYEALVPFVVRAAIDAYSYRLRSALLRHKMIAIQDDFDMKRWNNAALAHIMKDVDPDELVEAERKVKPGLWNCFGLYKKAKSPEILHKKADKGQFNQRQEIHRKHIYYKAFNHIDVYCNQAVTVHDMYDFITFMAGEDGAGIPKRLIEEWFFQFHGVSEGLMRFNDFCDFCDRILFKANVTEYLKEQINGFIEKEERDRNKNARMWKETALSVDQFTKWTIILGFIGQMIFFFTMPPETLDFEGNAWMRTFLILCGFLPFFGSLLVLLIMRFVKGIRNARMKRLGDMTEEEKTDEIGRQSIARMSMVGAKDKTGRTSQVARNSRMARKSTMAKEMTRRPTLRDDYEGFE